MKQVLKYFIPTKNSNIGLVASICTLFFIGVLMMGCRISPPPFIFKAKVNSVSHVKLPDGFEMSFFAKGVKNARSLCLSDKGTVFVGSRGEGKVYALPDKDGDFVADTVIVIAEKLNKPNGVAFKDGILYVAEVSQNLAIQ